MTIRQLQYFVKIYECGNLLNASRLLFVSQQALSRALSTLEQEIGQPLFLRHARGVVPTQLGKELYQSSLPVLQEMDALEAHIRQAAHPQSAQLNVGIAAGPRFLNIRSLWRPFQERHAPLEISVQEYPYLACRELLLNGRLDLITFSDLDFGEAFIQIPVKLYPRAVIVPAEHPLAQGSVFDPSGFRDERLAFYTNSLMREKFDHRCRSEGWQPKETIVVDDALYLYETCQHERCLGLTIQGYFSDVFQPIFPSLRMLPLPEDFFPYEISAVFRRDHPRRALLQELIAYLRDYMVNK